MQEPTKTFSFSGQVWLWNSTKAAWHFVSVPSDISVIIMQEFEFVKQGWGSIRVNVLVGDTHWTTSIFPDTQKNVYLLPLKASVRKKESIAVDDTIAVHIEIADAM